MGGTEGSKAGAGREKWNACKDSSFGDQNSASGKGSRPSIGSTTAATPQSAPSEPQQPQQPSPIHTTPSHHSVRDIRLSLCPAASSWPASALHVCFSITATTHDVCNTRPSPLFHPGPSHLIRAPRRRTLNMAREHLLQRQCRFSRYPHILALMARRVPQARDRRAVDSHPAMDRHHLLLHHLRLAHPSISARTRRLA